MHLCFAIKRLAPLLQLVSSCVTDQGVFSAQVVALVYLCLTALIQLNLLATRNPSLWWRFGSGTAPRHAPPLLCCPTAQLSCLRLSRRNAPLTHVFLTTDVVPGMTASCLAGDPSPAECDTAAGPAWCCWRRWPPSCWRRR